MKNTIKILCLILLITCNLSTWANPIAKVAVLANKAAQTIERELPSIRTVSQKASDLFKVTQNQTSKALKGLSTLQKELPKEKVISAKYLNKRNMVFCADGI